MASQSYNKTYQKTYRQAHKEETKAYQKAYRQANKEELKAYNKAYGLVHKEKLKSNSKTYRQANKEELKAYDKARYEANKEKRKACMRTYCEANKEKKKIYDKAYREANPQKKCANNHRRRAKKALVVNAPIRPNFEAFLKEIWDNCCAYCKKASDKFHMDHFMPLDLKGHHAEYNLVLACPGCNHSKGAKHPLAFIKEQKIDFIFKPYMKFDYGAI